MKRVLLVGLGPTTLTAAQSLIGRFEIVGLVRPFDADDAVIRLARAADIMIYTDKSPRAIDRIVADLEPDCVVVSSYDRILGPALLARCPFVNVHYAPLPQYRGRATVNWALINGESHVAISIHELVPQLDGGRILFQQQVEVAPADTVATLYERLNAIQLGALADVIERFLDGERGYEQDHARATYSCTRLPGDGEIEWQQPTARVDALVRALVEPFPGAFTYLDGARLTVWRAAPVPAPVYAGRIPGRVVGLSKPEGWVDVLTGDGVLRLLEVQRNGARVPPATLITSVKTTLGLQTVDLIARINALEMRLAELTALVYGVNS